MIRTSFFTWWKQATFGGVRKVRLRRYFPHLEEVYVDTNSGPDNESKVSVRFIGLVQDDEVHGFSIPTDKLKNVTFYEAVAALSAVRTQNMKHPYLSKEQK